MSVTTVTDTGLLKAAGSVPQGAMGLAKRSLDVVVCAVALVFVAPLLLAIAVLVKAQDGGPVFFKHTRIGQGGRAFTLIKFRTMRVDADQELARVLAASPTARADWHRIRKLPTDPRVTRIGRFLRRSSLDEIPQLLNILKGEMSLVGPRPVTAEELTRFGPDQNYYKAVRPGLTGLWQVSGRNTTNFETRVALDADYAKNWRFTRDLVLLAKTVPAVLFGRGAY